MTAATTRRPAVTGHAVAEGLRALARIFDSGDVPARICPDQGLAVSVSLTTATAVHEFAARFGVPVDVADHRGQTHTSFEVPLGVGSNPGSSSAAYAGAVAFNVYNIAEVTP